ncbi:MAG: hypothetical protein ACR2FY_02240 [Pirellulaceae bacterium]
MTPNPRMVFAFLLAAPLALAGCGSGETAAKPLPRPEKTITPEQLLEGQWQGQMILDEEVKKQLPPAQVAKLQSMTMGMEFQPGGRLILAGMKDDGKPYESEAAWEVVKATDDQITIKSIEANGKETDAVLMFEDDDVFLMPLKTEVANLGAMRFERLK